MGKRYYCDYCDRSFIDDVESRKKHINSNHHVRNRKVHYTTCRDLPSLIEEESKKDECKRFRNTGYCPFQEYCNFTHFSKEELKTFSKEVKGSKKTKVLAHKLPALEDWLNSRGKPVCSTIDRPDIEKSLHFLYNINPGMLPPSLHPITIAAIKNYHPVNWG